MPIQRCQTTSELLLARAKCSLFLVRHHHLYRPAGSVARVDASRLLEIRQVVVVRRLQMACTAASAESTQRGVLVRHRVVPHLFMLCSSRPHCLRSTALWIVVGDFDPPGEVVQTSLSLRCKNLRPGFIKGGVRLGG